MTAHEDDERRYLASTLKSLRVDAGLSTTQLARALGWSQSKVSKTELGRSLPPSKDVDAWARKLNADEHLRERLVEIANRAGAQAVEWRRELVSGLRQRQKKIQQLEATASVIRVFSENVMIGLTQTRAYMEAVFRFGSTDQSADESIDDIVQARLDRQELLSDHNKEFRLLLSEAVLWRRVVPAFDMRVQLQRLIDLSERPNIVFEVIPFDAEEREFQYHSFVILGEPVIDKNAIVLVETVTRALTIQSTEEVNEYIGHFENLRTGAIRGEQLRTFLRNLGSQLQ